MIFVATAYAPNGKAVPSFDVRVEVGPLSKSLVVFGKRLWVDKGAALTAPAPIEQIDMRYDHAWGGRDDDDPAAPLEEPRNPIGTGVTRAGLAHPPAGAGHRGSLVPDPDREDRAASRGDRSRRPALGAAPRVCRDVDAAWRENRAPLLPGGLRPPLQPLRLVGPHRDPPLAGGEPVRTLNLTPEGALSFELPKVQIEIEFHVKDRAPVAFAPHLDTVLVDLYATGPQKPVAVEMVWRAHVKAPRRMKDARVIVRERGRA